MSVVTPRADQPNFRQRIIALPDKGLWPYTADPAPIGLVTWGKPHRDQPIWLCGNSRHDLSRLRRHTQAAGLRVAVIDTGGLTLAEMAARQPVIEDLAVALDQVASEAEPGIALLPYPVWQMLGEADYFTEKGWAIMAGPADARDLPTFWRLEEREQRWQQPRPDRVGRLQALAAHAAPITLLILLPLLYLSPVSALAGALTVLIAVASAFLAAEAGGTDRPLVQVGLASTLGGVVSSACAGLALKAGHLPAPGSVLLLSLLTVLLAIWFSALLTHTRR